jgi:hypothetical protein
MDVSGTRTLYAACTPATVLSATCACGSLDNSVGTVSGYVDGKICTKGATNGADVRNAS